MFAESLIIVASACSNGACPPVVASNYQVQVQQPVQQIVQSEWVSTGDACINLWPAFFRAKLNSVGERKVRRIQIFNFPSQRVCTKGCK